jgi:hypothetical protein
MAPRLARTIIQFLLDFPNLFIELSQLIPSASKSIDGQVPWYLRLTPLLRLIRVTLEFKENLLHHSSRCFLIFQ